MIYLFGKVSTNHSQLILVLKLPNHVPTVIGLFRMYLLLTKMPHFFVEIFPKLFQFSKNDSLCHSLGAKRERITDFPHTADGTVTIGKGL